MFSEEAFGNSCLFHVRPFSKLMVKDVKSKRDQINPLNFLIVLFVFLLISTSGFTQWRQSSKGMYGGNVSAFYVDTVSGYMYASSSGVIMSKDNGNTWKAIDSTLVFEDKYKYGGGSQSVRNGYVSPAGRYVYSITTRGKHLLIGTSAGVYASPDNGKTWEARNIGLHDPAIALGGEIRPMIVYAFAFKDTETYIGTSKGVYYSADTGKNWVHKIIPYHNEYFTISDLVFVDDDLLTATWDYGAYVSRDKGNTWIGSSTGLAPYGTNMRNLELTGDSIYAATVAGVHLSSNNGQTWSLLIGKTNWSNVHSPNSYSEVAAGTVFNSLSIEGDTILASNPKGDSAKLFISVNEGSSWSGVNTPAPSEGYFDTYIHQGNFFMGTDYGILKSKDGGRLWHSSDTGIIKLGVTSLCKSGNRYFAGTSTNGIFVSENNGDTWMQVNNGLEDQNGHWNVFSARFIRALAVKNDTVFAATDGSGVFYSSNNGASWTAINSGLTGKGLFVHSLTFSGNQILAGTNAGFYVNIRNTWMHRATQPLNQRVTEMISSGNNIYASTYQGVYMSRDRGWNWTDINGDYTPSTGFQLSSTRLESIAVIDKTIFTSSSQYIFRSDDSGKTWKKIATGVGTDKAGKIIYSLFSKGSVICASTGAGVYLSIDKGEHWTAINEGLFNLGVQHLTVIDSFMYAGTLNDGLWKRSLSDFPEIPADTTGSDPTNVQYVKFKGINLYPNPAEDYIIVSFDELFDEEYVAEVFSIAGNVLLKTQVKRTQNTINLEGLDYHGFCILKITDLKGKVKGIQKMIRL